MSSMQLAVQLPTLTMIRLFAIKHVCNMRRFVYARAYKAIPMLLGVIFSHDNHKILLIVNK